MLSSVSAAATRSDGLLFDGVTETRVFSFARAKRGRICFCCPSGLHDSWPNHLSER